MPQIFYRSMNTFARVSIFGAVLFIAAAIVLGGIIVRAPSVTEEGVVQDQPVPFSHEHHVGRVGLDCRFCHSSVETAATAGMPSTEVCLNCHSQLFSDAEMLAPVRESARSGRPLRWRRVYDVPDYAYFNHSIHIHKGVACESCHGRVDKMPLMWRDVTLHMEWCLKCHRDPAPAIRPREEVFAQGWQPLTEEVAVPHQWIDKYHVQSKTDCNTCHR